MQHPIGHARHSRLSRSSILFAAVLLLIGLVLLAEIPQTWPLVPRLPHLSVAVAFLVVLAAIAPLLWWLLVVPGVYLWWRRAQPAPLTTAPAASPVVRPQVVWHPTTPNVPGRLVESVPPSPPLASASPQVAQSRRVRVSHQHLPQYFEEGLVVAHTPRSAPSRANARHRVAPVPPAAEASAPTPASASSSSTPSVALTMRAALPVTPQASPPLDAAPTDARVQAPLTPPNEVPPAPPETAAEVPGSPPGEASHAAPRLLASVAPRPGTESTPVYLALTLLGTVTVTLLGTDGSTKPVPLPLRSKRRELVAYLGWHRGKRVGRERLVDELFAHGRSDELASPKSLSEAFEWHKKVLRRDLRTAAASLNAERLRDVLPPNALFVLAYDQDQDAWALSAECAVADLEAIEASFQIIEQARGEVILTDDVQAASLALIGAYRADFAQKDVEDLDFGPGWQDHWMREPFTYYRTCYLTALWCRAEYFRIQGSRMTEATDTERGRQQTAYAEAARLYRRYALYGSTRTLFDQLPKQRLALSERALRAALWMDAATSNTQEADEVYRTFGANVRPQFPDWKPGEQTRRSYHEAQAQTGEHRFVSHIPPHADSEAESEV